MSRIGKVCLYCEGSFLGHPTQLCCSRKCSSRFTAKSRGVAIRKGQLRSKKKHPEIWERVYSNLSNPTKLGGNGRKPPRPQKLLHKLIGGELEYSVRCGKGSMKKGWPPVYKVDIGFPDIKVGIEIDGESHSNPRGRAKDRIKDNRLGILGWRVLRFRNKDVLGRPTLIAKQIKEELEL